MLAINLFKKGAKKPFYCFGVKTIIMANIISKDLLLMVETIDNSGDLVIFSLAIPIALCWTIIRDFAMHAD